MVWSPLKLQTVFRRWVVLIVFLGKSTAAGVFTIKTPAFVKTSPRTERRNDSFTAAMVQ